MLRGQADRLMSFHPSSVFIFVVHRNDPRTGFLRFRQNLKEEDRSRLSAELWGLIKGKAKEVIKFWCVVFHGLKFSHVALQSSCE